MGIQVTNSSMPSFEDYIEEIKELWDSHSITNMGTKHKKLEEDLLKYLNADNINLFTNGHLALECAIEALGLKGEVITTPFTFISTTNAIVRKGLTPVFCDINTEDYTMDPEKIEKLITEKTCAIIPVHVYGNICNLEKIDEIAKKYKLKVIYDAAHAFGVDYKGTNISNFGDVSMFSFHATKVFNTIEGGALIYKDKSLYKKLNDIKNFGITGVESADYIGGNAKMNEFQAAMGICNLRNINNEIEKRKLCFERYIHNLKNIEGIELIEFNENIKPNYSYFPVLFNDYKYSRDEMYEMLKMKNINSRKYFYPLISDLECYKNKFNSDDTPNAKFVSERILCLPLYADLNVEIVDEISEIIKNS